MIKVKNLTESQDRRQTQIGGPDYFLHVSLLLSSIPECEERPHTFSVDEKVWKKRYPIYGVRI